MISQIFLILIQIQIIQNSEPKKLYSINYAIPFMCDSTLYFLGKKKIIFTHDLSSFQVSNTPSGDLTN